MGEDSPFYTIHNRIMKCKKCRKKRRLSEGPENLSYHICQSCREKQSRAGISKNNESSSSRRKKRHINDKNKINTSENISLEGSTDQGSTDEGSIDEILTPENNTESQSDMKIKSISSPKLQNPVLESKTDVPGITQEKFNEQSKLIIEFEKAAYQKAKDSKDPNMQARIKRLVLENTIKKKEMQTSREFKYRLMGRIDLIHYEESEEQAIAKAPEVISSFNTFSRRSTRKSMYCPKYNSKGDNVPLPKGPRSANYNNWPE